MKISIILIGILMHSVLGQGQQNEGFISIDCGSLENYTQEYFSIYYGMDDTYIDTGVNMNISSEVLGNYSQDVRGMDLRSFPYGKRNCYTLFPNGGNENRYLIRASFFYGNYDGKNKTPVFDLYIGVNYWATVDFETYVYEEIIYKPTTNYIDVCLVDTGSGTPYISALELRTMNTDIYQIESGLFLDTEWRLDIGGNGSNARFAGDPYDRIWRLRSYDSMVVEDSSMNENNISISKWIESNDRDANDYKVPGDVLKTAQVSIDNSSPLKLIWSSNSTDKWRIFFHFAEINDSLTSQRQLSVSVNDIPSGTASLQYLVPETIVSPVISGSETIQFTISASPKSSAPPILNAVEIFLVRDLPFTPTHADDVGAMREIKKNYSLRRGSWQGDPCLPKAYSWEGLNCTNDNPPRITSLNLSSSELTGNIATALSNLSELVYLDLSNNRLTGEIPEALAKLSKLRVLNLTGNNLAGSIPEAMKKADLEVLWDGTANKKVAIVLIVAPVLGVSFLILIGAAGVYWWRTKRRRGHGPSNESKLKAKNRPFTYNEVVRITNNFDTIIGEGGFGKVYLGTLDNGIKVAVKMLSLTSKQGYKEFEAEAQLLMVVHHRNLVSLVGYCDDIRNIALIYEYMPAGNLREHFSEKKSNPLTWIQRLQIAVDAAQGLDYLHHGCKPPIIHRDLKSPNILLNENMQAKIADFGLSKAFGTENESYISTRPAGTLGYLDPEFQSTGNLSRKSDVYSFGIILFELITGQSAILRGPNGNIHILHWVTPFIERGDIESIMDPRLGGNFSINSAWKAVEIAMSCVDPT